MKLVEGGVPIKFLSTPSARRATAPVSIYPDRQIYFYPRPPRGGRHESATVTFKAKEFLSTPSARRATFYEEVSFGEYDTISIHALREEGDGIPDVIREQIRRFLSTPSARRATSRSSYLLLSLDISIHALREEGDLYPPGPLFLTGIFLSTPSARRATVT